MTKANCDVIEVFDEGAQESQNTVKTIPQFLNDEQKAQARENIEAAKQSDLDSEKTARIEGDAQLSRRIEAIAGVGGYLPAYDFGTPTPTQEQLTEYAISQIPNVTDPSEIFNGTRIKNLNNGHTWILTNTPNTTPPVFDWADNGFDEISVATNTELGVVKGSEGLYKGSINAEGEIDINGLPEKLSEIDTKANNDLANTDFITDCVLSAVNGIHEYVSGKSLTIKSGIDILFSQGRKAPRVFNNSRYQKQQDSTIIISGNAGDKVSVFINKADGSVFQTPTSKVYKGTKAPDDYTYFKNLNTNLWQKKGAATIPWTSGFGFSWNLYTGYCFSKAMFNGVLYLVIAGRYQSSFPYRTLATTDGKTATVLNNENWGELVVANGLLYSSTKGVTSDLVSFRAVTLPSTSPSIYGRGNWFYLFSSTDKKFHKTQDFIDYIELTYPTVNNYYPLDFDVDDDGNMIVALGYTQGYTKYVSNSQMSKNGGQSWADLGITGTAVKAANGIWTIGTNTGLLRISSNKGDSWVSKQIAASRVYSIEFGGGEWQAAITTALIITSNDNFTIFSEKNTGFAVGGSPSLTFGNGLFFMTDFSSNLVTGSWTSNSYIAYAQPASPDEIVIVTDILTCEVDSSGSNLINIQPKYPVDLLNMIDLSQIWDRLNKLETAIAQL